MFQGKAICDRPAHKGEGNTPNAQQLSCVESEKGYALARSDGTWSWSLGELMTTVRSSDVSDHAAAPLGIWPAYILLGGSAYLGEDSRSLAHLSALVSRLIQPRSGFIAWLDSALGFRRFPCV
jgi:hypothetical protein